MTLQPFYGAKQHRHPDTCQSTRSLRWDVKVSGVCALHSNSSHVCRSDKEAASRLDISPSPTGALSPTCLGHHQASVQNPLSSCLWSCLSWITSTSNRIQAHLVNPSDPTGILLGGSSEASQVRGVAATEPSNCLSNMLCLFPAPILKAPPGSPPELSPCRDHLLHIFEGPNQVSFLLCVLLSHM